MELLNIGGVIFLRLRHVNFNVRKDQRHGSGLLAAIQRHIQHKHMIILRRHRQRQGARVHDHRAKFIMLQPFGRLTLFTHHAHISHQRVFHKGRDQCGIHTGRHPLCDRFFHDLPKSLMLHQTGQNLHIHRQGPRLAVLTFQNGKQRGLIQGGLQRSMRQRGVRHFGHIQRQPQPLFSGQSHA
ncbi:hypothetical protein SHM7688_02187 [Shimia marina]|uniref:Uncharacterized protein n=1 Tax=Shimia marina TaxID=321267 RepID=A0A0N7LS63_9RHOB|nr:hypothetical protein SHM7688_02187 [Shimia marina]